MKFTVTMKDPDYSHNVREDWGNEKVQRTLAKFMEYDEYLTVEFDTETGTARVVPVNE